MKSLTLIETLVTIAIFALVMGVVSSFIVMGYRTQSYAFQQSRAIAQARKGIETMVKEIREAKGGDDGSYIIEKADDFEFVFYSDIDNNGKTERVRYFIEGTDFKKGVIEPTGWPIRYPLENEEVFILSQYVRNQPPIFKYYNGDWLGEAYCQANPTAKVCLDNPLPTPTRLKDTKLMHLYLVINVNPNRPPQDFELISDVQIRNLKTNL
jgi:type II secretory pathway pseudopilin PulG